MDNLESIMKGHAEIMRTGLKHGEQMGYGKLVDKINQMEDATGVSGAWNSGFRSALVIMRNYILAELRDKP